MVTGPHATPQPSMAPGRRARGFTLPEVMAVVVIMAVLAAAAAPSLTELIASQRTKSAASDLFASLLRTRSEAIKRNIPVTLVPKTATAWKDGWSIPNPANTADIIEEHGAVAGATITGPASVVYLPNGRLQGAAPEFDVQATGTSKARCIQVDLSGRPYQLSTACPE